ncbi:MAG: hypothetical protein U1F50_12330 [Rubrivivax sp.]
MSGRFESILGPLLYRLLPSVYRERDNPTDASPGDLALVLDAAGLLLDRVRGTLEQRLADAFPDLPDDGSAAGQEWLLPYFARLFDARLVAPDVAGQRAEVQHAVAWRQRKGTRVCAAQIAEALLQRPVVLEEGWRRVALTPRIGEPLLPAAAFGWPQEPDPRRPSWAAAAPGVQLGTPDLRRQALALRTRRSGPAIAEGTFGGATVRWVQAGPGTPRHPGAFDDTSRRCVDLRTPDWRVGHVHPRRLLVHAPPPAALFAPPVACADWADPAPELVRISYDPVECHLRIASAGAGPVRFTGAIDLLSALSAGQRAALPADDAGRALPRVTLEGVHVDGTVTLARGRLVASAVALRALALATNDYAAPVIEARDSLFGRLQAADGRVRLDACSVLGAAECGALEATDSLFAGTLALAAEAGALHPPRLQRCRVPAATAALLAAQPAALVDCTTEAPVFFPVPADEPFGPAHAVLAPETAAAICTPAGGEAEMGCFHHGRRRPVHLRGVASVRTADHGYVLRDLVFERPLVAEVGRGPLRLARCALAGLTLDGPKRAFDAVVATDTLFGRLDAAARPVQLEYCTVLGALGAGRLHASDCIFAGTLELGGSPAHCIRFSRVPPSNTRQPRPHCTTETPVFVERDFARGAAGCGVLHPATPASIAGGAEDGGEMGAGHAFAHARQRTALADKLADHLPVGLEAVLVGDARLDVLPPLERE